MTHMTKSRNGGSLRGSVAATEMKQLIVNPFREWYERKFKQRLPLYLESAKKKKLYSQFLNQQS